jgi:hypothetical protein
MDSDHWVTAPGWNTGKCDYPHWGHCYEGYRVNSDLRTGPWNQKHTLGIHLNNKGWGISSKTDVWNLFQHGQQVRRNWSKKRRGISALISIAEGIPDLRIVAVFLVDFNFLLRTLHEREMFVKWFLQLEFSYYFLPHKWSTLREVTLSEVDTGHSGL